MKSTEDAPQASQISLNLGFDPSVYGIDVEQGTVEGERVGVLSAAACAIAIHGAWSEFTAPAPSSNGNGHGASNGQVHGQFRSNGHEAPPPH
jgi:hypothetical protein